ncbi:hypothetical protein [Hymenobacter chitinivorans]|uniref:Uncharacterized protein n=1 Tax=Hymenobacter chitinivorans DSM 11115 TaxID=1121954 RepID=A0A2M9BL16_9BACT|nr:hypothetical protein [Hymenobacter chitinivorans]PJJ58610.1 hypothetical protein CLV45_0020 [Hymenobacter chitinivorans DSM 11115]
MHSIKSKFHDIELIHYGCVEPNNGRMLWEVDLKINGELVTEKYFGGWPRTDMPDKYEPDSPDGRFFFIAEEGGGFVLDTHHDFKAIGFSCLGPSAATFRGNIYSDRYLFLVHYHEVILFDLTTLTQRSLAFPDLGVRWIRLLDDSRFEILYQDPETRQQAARLVVL